MTVLDDTPIVTELSETVLNPRDCLTREERSLWQFHEDALLLSSESAPTTQDLLFEQYDIARV